MIEIEDLSLDQLVIPEGMIAIAPGDIGDPIAILMMPREDLPRWGEAFDDSINDEPVRESLTAMLIYFKEHLAETSEQRSAITFLAAYYFATEPDLQPAREMAESGQGRLFAVFLADDGRLVACVDPDLDVVKRRPN